MLITGLIGYSCVIRGKLDTMGRERKDEEEMENGERFWVSDPFSFDIQWITSAIKARNVAYSSGVNYTEPRNSL